MSDLSTFARKIMRINERVVSSNTPSAIFGSVGDLPQAISSRPPLRIGMFPCLSDDDPQLALGAWTVLAHLLERWRDVEVYRLFVSFEDSVEDFTWTIDKSQFSVAEWDLEHLDENIGLWGRLTHTDTGWQLVATIDNDNLTGDDAEPLDLTLIATNDGDLIAKLPAFAEVIAHNIDADRVAETDPAYPSDKITSNEALRNLLQGLFDWEVNLLASLWGVEWDDDEIVDAFHDLLALGEAQGGDFAAWSIAKAVAETMRPGYSVIGDLLIDHVADVVTRFNSHYPMPILVASVFNMGFAQKSYQLLQTEVEQRPQNTIAWLKFAEILAEGGLILESIDRFQTAIEQEAVNNDLFRAYGNVLLVADRTGQNVESFILIDLAEHHAGDYIIQESIVAYAEAIKLDSGDIRAYYARILQLAEHSDMQESLWDDFIKLIELDHDGHYTSDAIESLYNVSDIQPGVEALKALIEQNPERLDLYVNLAALYVIGYQNDLALPLLEDAKAMTDDVLKLAEIERLELTADNPDFEYRFAEIVSILDAGNVPKADDVEFLEEVVERAPHVIAAHIALGQSYYYWRETDEALEVLLDAQETFPNDPFILDWIGRILWESDERETAFQYLNMGIQAHPFNVQLIARAGQYLFDNDQFDEARQFLARAEEIAPRHPMLKSVQAYIARQIEANPDKYHGHYN
ncbi:MAG: tetratricopeptide repeat protein [Anaerolineae bacterium]